MLLEIIAELFLFIIMNIRFDFMDNRRGGSREGPLQVLLYFID